MIGSLMVDNFSSLHLFHDPYRFAINMITLFLFLASVTLLFFPQILYGKEDLVNHPQQKYSSSRLSRADKKAILDELTAYLNSGDMPFLDPNISLNKLAELLNISPYKLSQVINENLGINFNDYLNKYRIDYAIKLLSSPDQHKFTIEAIALKA